MSNVLSRIETPGLCWHMLTSKAKMGTSFRLLDWKASLVWLRVLDDYSVPCLAMLTTFGRFPIFKFNGIFKLCLRLAKIRSQNTYCTNCPFASWPNTMCISTNDVKEASDNSLEPEYLKNLDIIRHQFNMKTRRNTLNINRLTQMDSKKQKFSNRSPEATLSVSNRSSSVLSKPVVWRLPMRLLLPCKAQVKHAL